MSNRIFKLLSQNVSDLAASIITGRPPSTSLVLPSEDSILNDVSPATQSHDECLCCLANSLRLVYHQLIPLLSGFHNLRTQATGSHTGAWDRWSDLWMTCTIWFQTRPQSMEPVLESSEDSEHLEEPFPPDVFTSAIALQANLMMHMSAVILLAHRPRLGNVVASSYRLRSRSWHIQKVARMLVGNHFREQWDPIVIATLLFIAKEMSHVSQQESLLPCFHEAALATRIPVERDIANVRACWLSIYKEVQPDVPHCV